MRPGRCLKYFFILFKPISFIICLMLKKVIIMLIVAVTLQLSWTMASAYCMHETDQSAQHFGHHPHQHEASDSADGDKNTTGKKVTSHPDCASCTHGSSVANTWQTEQVKPLLISYELSLERFELSSPCLGKPLRPKWMIAA